MGGDSVFHHSPLISSPEEMSGQVTKYPYLISKYAFLFSLWSALTLGLFSRYMDPLFGVAVGMLSFYSYEQRVGREDGHTLKDLVLKKASAMRAEWNKPKN